MTEHRDKPKKRSPGDRRWNEKQGTPQDPAEARTVERASSRYSASEQSEEKLEKDRERGRRGKG